MDADGWDLRYAAAERVFSTDPNPFVAEAVEGLAPGRALDLAAGEGKHALWLARRGWNVTAVDFSRVGVDKGRRESEADDLPVDWVVADVYDYEPGRESFDLVLIVQFHPRPDDRAAFFARTAEALAPGGRLVIVGRHVDDIGRDGGRGPRDPGFRYTPAELAAVLPAGLEVERCESAVRTVAGDAGPIHLTDVVAVTHRR